MEKYHLNLADIEATKINSNKPHIEETMGTTISPGYGINYLAWENTLLFAIKNLVGSVGVYRTRSPKVEGAFKVERMGASYCWYGVAEDTKLAAELFDEWDKVIATLAMGKYGCVAKNEGARYALGFATALLTKSYQIAEARKHVITPSTTAITKLDQGSLATILRDKTKKAELWLREDKGIKLRKASGSTSYSMRGSGYDAYQAGQADGYRAEFSANRTKKLN